MAPIFIPDVNLFTAGRACAGPLAVVLHSYSSGIETLDGDMQHCLRPRPAQSPGCHTSFHFGIGTGGFHQYVDEDDTAWGFGVTPPACPQPVCQPGPCESCTGITVDQYNTDLDGNPPTLPAWGAGPDGTVNCAVLHVAVTGQSSGSDPDCCRFFQDPRAYNQLVASLCYIFSSSGLTPSQDTLLVHCEELICLDIDQLVADILAFDCDVTPVNPCNSCPPLVADTFSIDLTVTGPTVTADAVIDPAADNQLSVSASGLYVPPGAVLNDCTGNPIDEDQSVITRDQFQVAGTTTNTRAIWASIDSEGFLSCPMQLIAPDCGDTLTNELPLVLGSLGSGGGLEWGTPQRGPLLIHSISGGVSIDPADGYDVYTLTGASDQFQLLNPPTGCGKTDLWIKNLSATSQEIDSGALMDGVAAITLQGTVPAGYPFGNNGGETVHLVWTGSTWLVI